jgi:hypothetical protein
VVGGGLGGGVDAATGTPENATTATSASSSDTLVTVRFYQRPLRSGL